MHARRSRSRAADDLSSRRTEIGTAREDELEALSALARRAKASWGYPPAWLAIWAPQLTVTVETLRSTTVFVARSGGRPLGFSAVRVEGELAELEHLWVEPEEMGRGIGRSLLAAAADVARQAGAHTLRIESDPHAEAFYRSLGCRRIGAVAAPVAGVARELPVLELDLAAGRVTEGR